MSTHKLLKRPASQWVWAQFLYLNDISKEDEGEDVDKYYDWLYVKKWCMEKHILELWEKMVISRFADENTNNVTIKDLFSLSYDDVLKYIGIKFFADRIYKILTEECKERKHNEMTIQEAINKTYK